MLCRYLLQNIAHPAGDTDKVLRFQRLHHSVNVRMYGVLIQNQMLIDKFGGHGKDRFGNEEPAVRNRRKRGENLTDSLG